MIYTEQYKKIQSALGDIAADSPEMMKHFTALHKSSINKGALPSKCKELIALGISISIRCNECITYHIHDAINAGATDEEIVETINVSVMMGGGPALMYATHAYRAMEEIRAINA